MDHDIIRTVIGMGFDVYMRDPDKDTWLIFVDDGQLGMLQYRPMEGFTLSTMHVPNRHTGTGFQVARHVPDINEAQMRECFQRGVPSWMPSSTPAPVKWRGIQDFLNRDSWNAGYRQVTLADLETPTA